MRTHATQHLSNSSGFSLVEMLIAVAVMGLMTAFALPKLRDGVAARDVKSAKAAVANMYARARMNALQTRKTTTVNFSSTDVWVTAPITGGLDTIGAPAQLSSLYGVTVTPSVSSIRVMPTGLANMSTAATITLSRSGKSDSVTISGYGRVQ